MIAINRRRIQSQTYKYQCDSLNFDGTTYTNLDYKADQNTSVEVVFSINSGSAAQTRIFCGGGSSSGIWYDMYVNANGKLTCAFGEAYPSDIDGADGLIHSLFLDGYNRKAYVDGVLYAELDSVTGSSTQAMCVGAHGSNPKFLGKIYSVRIWQSGNLMCNFVPVLNEDNIPALYDKISGKIYIAANPQGTSINYIFKNMVNSQYAAKLDSTATWPVDMLCGLHESSNVNYSLRIKFKVGDQSNPKDTVFNAMWENGPSGYPGEVFRVGSGNNTTNVDFDLGPAGGVYDGFEHSSTVITNIGTVLDTTINVTAQNVPTHNKSSFLFGSFDANNNPFRLGKDVHIKYVRLIHNGVKVREIYVKPLYQINSQGNVGAVAAYCLYDVVSDCVLISKNGTYLIRGDKLT